jgi:uncharacterized membrane protein
MEVHMSGFEPFNFWWLIPLVLIGLCIFGVRGCCAGSRHWRETLPGQRKGAGSVSALEFLNRRYARGEIDDEEYQRKSETITQAGKEAMK